MKRIAMLALVVTAASCAEGNAPDGGLPDDGGGNTSTYSVTGSVTGPGQANAALTLQGTGTPRTTTSNASGGFQFLAVPAGDYTLTVTQKGFVYTPPTQAVKVVSADVKAAEISSAAEQTGSAVSGMVSGDVKAKVLLTLTQNGATVGTTFSSDVGAYRLDGVADGTYTLTPSLAGYTFTPASQSVTVDGKAVTAQEFVARSCPVKCVIGWPKEGEKGEAPREVVQPEPNLRFETEPRSSRPWTYQHLSQSRMRRFVRISVPSFLELYA